MRKIILAGVLMLLVAASVVAENGAQSPLCVITAVEDVTAYMKADFIEVFDTLEAGTSVEAQTRTLSGWYGFDPGIAQAPNEGLARLRWLPVDLQPGMRLDGDCASLPPVDGGIVPPTAIPDPRIVHFAVTATGTLNDFTADWAVEGTDAVVLEVHLPGDPSGEPMLVLDELPLTGSQVVTVPFHTPDTGARFVVWGVNRVATPPSPQERYEYVVSQTVDVAPFATPTPSATWPPLTPSPTYTPRPGGDLFDVPSTHQRFDNGFMIWRSDTGFIWAFANDGRVFGVALADYGNLPLPDSRVTLPPPGKSLPIMGFGRVWANYPGARSALGWPATSESSFLLGLGFNFERDTQLLRLPDQRWIELLHNSAWRYVGNSGPLPPTPASPTPIVTPNRVVTGATYQPFHGGFMLWRADTGHILVFSGHNSGTMSVFSVLTYGGLPDNPISDTPPPGSIKPVLGFGKVWGNRADVRNVLGWATGSEQGYTLTMNFLPGGNLGMLNAVLTLPDGRKVLTDHGNWHSIA